MTTRTLSDFRAEYNIWRKDLARELEMSEAQLERLELMGEVPQAVADKLTAAYGLSETYFTEDVDRARAIQAAALRKSPKRPLAYFCKVSVVWYALLMLAAFVFILPTALVETPDYATSSLFYALERFCFWVIIAFSGIYLGAHILQKTNFRGDVGAYEFLYPYFLSTLALSGFWGLRRWFAPNASFIGALLAGGGWTSVALISGVIVLSVLLCVFLVLFLDTAALERGVQKQKRLWILCAVVLVVQGLSLVLYLFDDTLHGEFCILRTCLLLIVLGGVLFGTKYLPQAKSLWYTVLPLTAMLLPELLILGNSILHLGETV